MPRRIGILRRSSPWRRSRLLPILFCIVILLLDITISLQESANATGRRELDELWITTAVRPSALTRFRRPPTKLVRFQHKTEDASERIPVDRVVPTPTPILAPLPPPFCSMEQYFKGKWQERSTKPQSLADIRNQSSLGVSPKSSEQRYRCTLTTVHTGLRRGRLSSSRMVGRNRGRSPSRAS